MTTVRPLDRKRVHEAMKVVKVYDKSSPKLSGALSGEHMKNVTIKWYASTPRDRSNLLHPYANRRHRREHASLDAQLPLAR